jgi:glutamyl-tRNA synthetase
VQKHGAVFDVVKLTWMNGEYIRTAPLERLVDGALELLAREPNGTELRTERDYIAAVCRLMRERTKTLAELVRGSRYLFTSQLELTWDDSAVQKRAGTAEARRLLREVGDALRAAGDRSDFTWERGAIETVVRDLAERTGRKAGDFIGPMRVAITGMTVSAGIFETAEVLGASVTLGRIDAFLRRYDPVAVGGSD